MACHSKISFKVMLLILLNLGFLTGCTELGDIVAIKYLIGRGSVELNTLDGDFLPKGALGKSQYCHTRRSMLDNNKWLGVCVSPDRHEVVVYKSFGYKFKVDELGITKEFLESKDFAEMAKIAEGVESTLNKSGIIFEKERPKYVPFQSFQKQFEFTR